MGLDLRLINNMSGGFVFNETEMLSLARREELFESLEYVYSNFSLIVDRHRSIFNNLWNAGIPASQRIREIEEKKESSIHDQISGEIDHSHKKEHR